MRKPETVFPAFHKTLEDLFHNVFSNESTSSNENEERLAIIFQEKIAGFMLCLLTCIEEGMFSVFIVSKIKEDVDSILDSIERIKNRKKTNFSEKQNLLLEALRVLHLNLDLYCKNRK